MKSYSYLTLSLLIFITLLTLSGCGGDGKDSFVPNPVPSAETATLVITADWPEEGKDLSAQVIPAGTVKIEVKVQTTGNFQLKQADIIRPANSVTITGLPVNQKLQIVFRALDASNNIVSHRISIRTLSAGTNTTSVQLGVTIRGHQLLPSSLAVHPGDRIMWGARDAGVAYRLEIQDPNGAVNLDIPAFDLNNPNASSARYTVPENATNNITYTLYEGTTLVVTGTLAVDTTAGHSFESALNVSLPYSANHSISTVGLANYYKFTFP